MVIFYLIIQTRNTKKKGVITRIGKVRQVRRASEQSRSLPRKLSGEDEEIMPPLEYSDGDEDEEAILHTVEEEPVDFHCTLLISMKLISKDGA